MNAVMKSGLLANQYAALAHKAELNARFKNRFNSLGIPVDNLSLEEAVEEVFELINRFEMDKTPRLVATLNVDFLVNSLGFSFNRPRHPELLNILRGADIVTADGFPIVLLSKLSGCPLKQRVTGADLMPELAKAASEQGKSIYLLGGDGDTAAQAAELLKSKYPDLKVAGTSAPMVAVAGEKLAQWEDDDNEIVEQINRSKADILFLAFGNPKQELWWSRNKYRLKVPVSIGVGGTFAFITGRVKRAPLWMQKNNLEWIYRISQDPKRLVKRYAIGIVKFGFLTLPLVMQRLQRKLNNLFVSPSRSGQRLNAEFDWKIHWAAKDDVLKTLRLPPEVSREYLQELVMEIQHTVHSEQNIYNYMIDFSQVKQLSMASNEAFCELARLFANGSANGLMIGISKSLQKRLEKARVMDIASSTSVSVEKMQESIMSDQEHSQQGEFKTYSVGDSSFSYFRGNIRGEYLATRGFETCMLESGKHKNIIIDLRRIQGIDSAALSLFYRLSLASKSGQIQSLRFTGINAATEQMLSVLEIGQTFDCISDKAFYDQVFGTLEKSGSES